jgi:hypothetical protein
VLSYVLSKFQLTETRKKNLAAGGGHFELPTSAFSTVGRMQFLTLQTHKNQLKMIEIHKRRSFACIYYNKPGFRSAYGLGPDAWSWPKIPLFNPQEIIEKYIVFPDLHEEPWVEPFLK